MALTVIIHLVGEEPFLAEMDELPDPHQTFLLLRNVRKRDGKAVGYVTEGATAFMYPWTRITFVEAMGEVPSAAAVSANGTPGSTKILGFFRDEDKR